MSESVWALSGSVQVGDDGKPHLVGGQCAACLAKLYPQPKVCPQCWGKEISPIALATRGKLYTYSIVHAGRPGWQTPYAISYVDLDDGVRVCAPLDLEAGELPAIGSVVELTTGPLRVDEKGVTHLSHRFTRATTGETA